MAKVGVDADEGIRGDSTADGLAKLKPAFGKDGTATAGNASQISDGAAAVLVMSEEGLKKTGATAIARIVDSNTAGVAPKELFFAPKLGIEAAKSDSEAVAPPRAVEVSRPSTPRLMPRSPRR